MASGLPLEFLAWVGQGRYQHPRTTLTLASGSTVDLPTLAFALPESDLGCPPPDLGQPCAGRGAAGARRRAPGWLGTSKRWWPHEAITLDSESRAPGLLGGGFQSLEWVLCDFSSCDQKHFSFWSPTPLGTPPPACHPEEDWSSSAVFLPAIQPLHPTATPLRSEFVKGGSGEN